MFVFFKVVIVLFLINTKSHALTLLKEWSVAGEYVADNRAVAAFDSTGNFYTAKYGDNLLRKYSNNGTLLWASAIDENLSKDKIAIDDNGSVYVCGNPNLSMVKYSSDGAHLWTHSYGEHNSGEFYIMSDSVGNIYLLNSFFPDYTGGSFVVPSDIKIIKISPNGIKLWEHIFASKIGNNSNIWDFSISMAIDKDDNIYILGIAGNFDDELYSEEDWKVNSYTNIFLSKLTSDGTVKWIVRSKRLANKLFFNDTNSLYTVFDSRRFTKINLDGTIDSNSTVDDVRMEEPIVDLKFDNEGNRYFLSGSYLQKVTTDGELAWTQLIKDIGTAHDFKIDENGSFYILGSSGIGKYTLTESLIAQEENSTVTATLTYLADSKDKVSWQLISAPIASDIDVNELDAKKVYGWIYSSSSNYHYQPALLKKGNGYWLLPNKTQTISFSNTASYDKEQMIESINSKMDFPSNGNRWLLFGVAYNVTIEELSKNLKKHKIERILQYNSQTTSFYTTTIIKAGSGFWVKMVEAQTYGEGQGTTISR